MIKENIPVFKPSMGKEECDIVNEVIKSGWIGMGPKTKQFEKEFAEYIKSKYAVSFNSATAALHLALKVLDIKKGDEIITTPMTFASTTESILYNNAVPVFADIDYGTMNIDPKSIERKITKKTKAILIVHFGGHSCDMDKIMKIAKKNKLIIIEDAAHACGGCYGGKYKGKKIGSLGNITCFSFHAVKNLAMGDGGMITCNNEDTINKLKRIRWLGISKDTYQRSDGKYKWDYDIVEEGYKYHTNDISASIGIIQLHKLDWMNNKRRGICSLYDSIFRKMKTPIDIPKISKSILHARHNYVIKLPDNIDREELIQYMSQKKISLGVHYKPIYFHPRYSKLNKKDTPITEKIWKRIVTLPVYPDLKKPEAKEIAKLINAFIVSKNEIRKSNN